MQRRNFLILSAAGLLTPMLSCNSTPEVAITHTNFHQTATNLLQRWTDGLLANQIDTPDDPTTHGALGCPACGRIHGRCMDAVYPFMHAYRKTGDEKYRTAAINVMGWAEANVSQDDGSWTVMPNPRTWRGISVFGAIALAETLKYHGDLLPDNIRQSWTERLERVGGYLLPTFDLEFTNINYGFTSLHAYVLMAEVLEDEKYMARAQGLATGIRQWFTEPHRLLFGEGKPSDALSPKGLHPVDLGYNVEESLNGVVHYAHHTGDEQLLDLLTESLREHLQFMLPDGGWDNSWGTRHAKWTYWGSRTTDGSQPAFSLLAERDPAFGTAVVRTTELLGRCTSDEGLIYGGLHYAEHGVPPCIHHTFTHAKPLAALLDGPVDLAQFTTAAPLPRNQAKGIKHFPEIDVWLLSRGGWRATASTYDFVYKEYALQGTGGALTTLWHEAVGPLFLASMPEYILVEKFNQQVDPDGEDYALTPRLELTQGETWYTNLYDLEANGKTEENPQHTTFTAEVRLLDRDENEAPNLGNCQLSYRLETDKTIITASAPAGKSVRLVLPLVSASTERVERAAPDHIRVHKPGGVVDIKASAPLHIEETKRERVFNMVPGVQALPLYVDVKEGSVTVSIKV